MKNFPIFAFAKGNESESFKKKLYIGVAPVYVLAVNPTKAELSKIYNTDIENEPVYINKTTINGKEVEQIRIDYIIKTDNDANLITRATFIITNSYHFNRDNTKVEVINKYGESTWLPVECIKNNAPIPENMKWWDASGVRPAYMGEVALTDFMKQYLNIPNKSFTKDGVTTTIDDLTKAEVGFEHIKDWFSGNFTELKDVLSIRPNNKVQIMFGVRTTDDNKQYQTVFTQKVLKLFIKNTDRLMQLYQEAKERGSYSNVEFNNKPFQEYKIEPTSFENTPTETDPLNGSDPWVNFN